MQLIDPPGGKPWALLFLCGASLLLNVVLIWDRTGRSDPAPAVVAVETAPAEVVELPMPAVQAALPAGMNVAHASVEHSLARTFQGAVPAEHADVLSAVYARLFVWEMDLRRDLQAGDRIDVAYSWDGALADIPVASYTSNKLGKTLRAYRFQASGDHWPSWWDENGREVAGRLVNGPLDDYEQITSLLKDRPTHKGIDFKVPEGTDVVSPKAGKVERTNWNVKFNGNCVEVRYDDGVLARFLHLSETAVSPGQRVSAGLRLGATGNTGHSTAPHLHYELERGGNVVDPVDYHGVTHRELPASDRDAFEDERSRLEVVLASAG